MLSWPVFNENRTHYKRIIKPHELAYQLLQLSQLQLIISYASLLVNSFD